MPSFLENSRATNEAMQRMSYLLGQDWLDKMQHNRQMDNFLNQQKVYETARVKEQRDRLDYIKATETSDINKYLFQYMNDPNNKGQFDKIGQLDMLEKTLRSSGRTQEADQAAQAKTALSKGVVDGVTSLWNVSTGTQRTPQDVENIIMAGGSDAFKEAQAGYKAEQTMGLEKKKFGLEEKKFAAEENKLGKTDQKDYATGIHYKANFLLEYYKEFVRAGNKPGEANLAGLQKAAEESGDEQAVKLVNTGRLSTIMPYVAFLDSESRKRQLTQKEEGFLNSAFDATNEAVTNPNAPPKPIAPGGYVFENPQEAAPNTAAAQGGMAQAQGQVSTDDVSRLTAAIMAEATRAGKAITQEQARQLAIQYIGGHK